MSSTQQHREVGTSFETEKRTITDTDIINFAGLSGDFNALHVNDLFAKDASPFGTRIAHGQLIAAIVTGLASNLDDWPVLSYLGASRRFSAPVIAGDTIFGRYEVIEVRSSNSRPENSIIKLALDVINQKDEVVMSGMETMLIEEPEEGKSYAPDRSRIYFEDIAEGYSFGTSRRSVTEADIIAYSAITGDHSPLHTDKTFLSEHTPFTDRLAQGWLVVGLQSGLRSELTRWQILAFLSSDYQWKVPAYPGDTLEANYKVVETRKSQSKPDRGVISIEVEVVNQEGDIVQQGTESFMVSCRGDG